MDAPANGVASRGIKAGRDDNEVGAVLVGDGDNDMVEGCHVVAVPHAAHGPGHIHCVALTCPLAHLLHRPSARIEVPPARSHHPFITSRNARCFTSLIWHLCCSTWRPWPVWDPMAPAALCWSSVNATHGSKDQWKPAFFFSVNDKQSRRAQGVQENKVE